MLQSSTGLFNLFSESIKEVQENMIIDLSRHKLCSWRWILNWMFWNQFVWNQEVIASIKWCLWGIEKLLPQSLNCLQVSTKLKLSNEWKSAGKKPKLEKLAKLRKNATNGDKSKSLIQVKVTYKAKVSWFLAFCELLLGAK